MDREAESIPTLMKLHASSRTSPCQEPRPSAWTRRSVVGSGLAASLISMTPVRADPARPTRIGFIFEDARVYVPVKLSSGLSGMFILDTGASGTILDAEFAQAAGVKVFGGRVVTGAGAGRSIQTQTHPITLEVGGIPLHVAEPSVSPLAALLGPTSGRRPAGIIGSQFFREHLVQLDFKANELSVHAPNARVPSGEAIPLDFDEWTPRAQVLLATPAGRTVQMHVLVDLGAKSTLLVPEPFIEATSLRRDFTTSRTTLLGAGMGGETRYAFARARNLSIGRSRLIALQDPIIGLSVNGTLKSSWHQGLLGADFLSRFYVAFDYARSQMILRPTGRLASDFDMSGLFLTADAEGIGDIWVREVMEDSPGQRSGVEPGDKIKTINGQRARTLGLARVRALLKSFPGRTIQLGMDRSGTGIDRSLRLARLL